jgi:hypothetical protein
MMGDDLTFTATRPDEEYVGELGLSALRGEDRRIGHARGGHFSRAVTSPDADHHAGAHGNFMTGVHDWVHWSMV